MRRYQVALLAATLGLLLLQAGLDLCQDLSCWHLLLVGDYPQQLLVGLLKLNASGQHGVILIGLLLGRFEFFLQLEVHFFHRVMPFF